MLLIRGKFQIVQMRSATLSAIADVVIDVALKLLLQIMSQCPFQGKGLYYICIYYIVKLRLYTDPRSGLRLIMYFILECCILCNIPIS